MRDLVYYIATTLDGFIAREDGSFEDFPLDEAYVADLLATYPETFPAPFRGDKLDRADNRHFDAVLMGRKTYEVGLEQGLSNPYPTLDSYVFSRTLATSPDSAVTVISEEAVETIRRLKQEPGRSIWLCGGGELASELFEAGLIDQVIVKLNPVLFGAGIPVFSRALQGKPLELVASKSYPSGHMLLTYAVHST